MEGVRSFGEVFVHMAGSTLLFCSYNGVPPPAGPAHDLALIYMKRGFEMPEIFAAESGIKTKAQTIAVMDQAFRALLIHMDEHLGEHLGQSIAYARVNHIVPPWSQKK